MSPISVNSDRTRWFFYIFGIFIILEQTVHSALGTTELYVRELPVENCTFTGAQIPLEAVDETLWPPSATSGAFMFYYPDTVICSLRAYAKMAAGFAFKDGVCIVFGVGICAEKTAFFKNIEDITPQVVSINKPAYSTPPYRSAYNAGKANDGSPSLFVTIENLPEPWWVVDLGQVYLIREVQISPRTGCCVRRFHDIEIRVGNTLKTDGDLTEYTLMAFYPGPYDATVNMLYFPSSEGIIGRFLSVQQMVINTNDALQMNEVTVIASGLF